MFARKRSVDGESRGKYFIPKIYISSYSIDTNPVVYIEYVTPHWAAEVAIEIPRHAKYVATFYLLHSMPVKDTLHKGMKFTNDS